MSAPPNNPPPFQLLELNVISGQDLAQVSRKMRTYAVAWVHPERKLSTRVDSSSHNNPTWNDKFVFRVDDKFLYRETSAIMVEIYAVSWFRDIHVGTVRVIVGNLIPPADHKKHQQHGVQLGMRFVALQVRRHSGRPQGILNIGVALLDASRRSMPLYKETASAVGYHHMMGENTKNNSPNKDDKSSSNNSSQNHQMLLPWMPKPKLRRTKSDTSSMLASEILSAGKAGSMINGVKAGSMINGGKAGSMINGNNSIKKKDGFRTNSEAKKPNNPIIKHKTDSNSSGGSGSSYGGLTKAKYGFDIFNKNTNGKPINSNNSLLNGGGPPLMTESELGPSASEVAAAMMKNRYRVEETESEIMGSWSLESSMEGLKSKLERWRTELPPVYDRSDISSLVRSSGITSSRDSYRHNRRHSEGGDGVFSCFGSVCGVQCSIVCGGSGSGSTRKSNKPRKRHSPSMDSLSFI